MTVYLYAPAIIDARFCKIGKHALTALPTKVYGPAVIFFRSKYTSYKSILFLLITGIEPVYRPVPSRL